MKIQKTNLKASSFLHMIAAASITVCMFTSCNGGLTEQSESDPAGTYRNYLLEVRKMKSISFEELSENLCQWQAIRDSVFNHVRQDTVGTHGQDLRKTCEGIHDSLRLEFSRLALSSLRQSRPLRLRSTSQEVFAIHSSRRTGSIPSFLKSWNSNGRSRATNHSRAFLTEPQFLMP